MNPHADALIVAVQIIDRMIAIQAAVEAGTGVIPYPVCGRELAYQRKRTANLRVFAKGRCETPRCIEFRT